jgi:hypothetical protein
VLWKRAAQRVRRRCSSAAETGSKAAPSAAETGSLEEGAAIAGVATVRREREEGGGAAAARLLQKRAESRAVDAPPPETLCCVLPYSSVLLLTPLCPRFFGTRRYAHAAAKFRLQGMPSAHLISSAGVNDMEVRAKETSSARASTEQPRRPRGARGGMCRRRGLPAASEGGEGACAPLGVARCDRGRARAPAPLRSPAAHAHPRTARVPSSLRSGLVSPPAVPAGLQHATSKCGC